jgi:hypothetical protein
MDEVTREDYLEAALVFLREAGMSYETLGPAESMLRLGFAIGTAEKPEALVPARCVEMLLEAKEQARKYREEQGQALNEANVTRAFAQGGFLSPAVGGCAPARRRAW